MDKHSAKYFEYILNQPVERHQDEETVDGSFPSSPVLSSDMSEPVEETYAESDQPLYSYDSAEEVVPSGVVDFKRLKMPVRVLYNEMVSVCVMTCSPWTHVSH